MSAFVYTNSVDFADTDAGGVVHFTAFLRWVARAEGAWFDSLGCRSFERHTDGGYSGYPRVNVRCDYRSPMFPGDTYAVRLAPQKIGNSSFTYGFKVYRGNEEGVLTAEGCLTIVFARAFAEGGFELKALPKPLAELQIEA